MLCVRLHILVIFFAVFSVAAVERQMVHGHVPPVVARLQAGDRLPGTNQMRLAIGLPFRHQGDLTNLLQRLYNPASADYHRFPATEEFIRQFAPLERIIRR